MFITDVEKHLSGRRKREIQEGPEQKRTKQAAISDLEIGEIRGEDYWTYNGI